MSEEGVRLQVYMARRGVGSRRSCERMIEEGRVTVNGRVVDTLGTRVGPGDAVTVDGRRLGRTERKRYVALNKPPRYLCANSDPDGRPLAVDLLRPAFDERLFHVGRLDLMSSGLVFYTNDGDFASVVGHPSSGIEKEYRVDTVQPVTEEMLESFRRGVTIEGTPFHLEGWRRVDERRVYLRLVEGKNREIRRVLGHFGLQLRRVHRTRIGVVSVRGLALGDFRLLRQKEVAWFMDRGRTQDGKASPRS